MKTITIEELLQLDQDTITVLDVRPADAYTRGSVPGAVSIPLAEVEERMEELPKEKPVYVLCHTGEWSVDAVYELEAPDMMRRILKADTVLFEKETK